MPSTSGLQVTTSPLEASGSASSALAAVKDLCATRQKELSGGPDSTGPTGSQRKMSHPTKEPSSWATQTGGPQIQPLCETSCFRAKWATSIWVVRRPSGVSRYGLPRTMDPRNVGRKSRNVSLCKLHCFFPCKTESLV